MATKKKQGVLTVIWEEGGNMASTKIVGPKPPNNIKRMIVNSLLEELNIKVRFL